MPLFIKELSCSRYSILSIDTKIGKYKVLVDNKFVNFIMSKSWHVTKKPNSINVYFQTRFKGSRKLFKLHRLLTKVFNPKNIVDHINGDTLDNRLINLRIVNFAQNITNSKKSPTRKNPYKGVYFCKRLKKYKISVFVNKKHLHGGYFCCPKKAALAYNKLALKYYGEYARLNKL